MWTCVTSISGATAQLIDTPPGAETDPPIIELEPAELDFGRSLPNTVVEGSFKIWNRGGGTLLIRDVHRTCGCTVVKLSPEQRKIAPGEFIVVDASLTPTKKNKKPDEKEFRRSVTVISNDPVRPRVKLELFTEIAIPIIAKPSSIYSRDALQGSTFTKQVQLESTCDEAFSIVDVQVKDGPVQTRFQPGVRALSHNMELTVGPIGSDTLLIHCVVQTDHEIMKEVMIPITIQPLKLVTVRPAVLLLGTTAPGSIATRQIRLSPAAGHNIDWVRLDVEDWPMIQAEASRTPGTEDFWDVTFKVPLELAGKKISGRVLVSTNVPGGGETSFKFNLRVDQDIELAPEVVSGT